MNRSQGAFFRTSLRVTIAAAAACACLVAGAARAENDPPGSLSRKLGLRTVVPEAPDFVARTRPQSYDFVPVGSPRRAPPGAPMGADDLRAQEKSLDAARARHDRVAGRKPAPKAETSVADGMGQAKRKAVAPAPCVGLACGNPGLFRAKPGQPLY